jgi:hypothetical protein
MIDVEVQSYGFELVRYRKFWNVKNLVNVNMFHSSPSSNLSNSYPEVASCDVVHFFEAEQLKLYNEHFHTKRSEDDFEIIPFIVNGENGSLFTAKDLKQPLLNPSVATKLSECAMNCKLFRDFPKKFGCGYTYNAETFMIPLGFYQNKFS